MLRLIHGVCHCGKGSVVKTVRCQRVREGKHHFVERSFIACSAECIRETEKTLLAIVVALGENIAHDLPLKRGGVGGLGDAESGRQTQLSRMRTENMQTERMDRGDLRAPEIADLPAQTGVLPICRQCFAEGASDSFPQFSRGGAGERDAQHAGDLRVRRGIRQQRDDALGERCSFSGARGGGEQEISFFTVYCLCLGGGPFWCGHYVSSFPSDAEFAVSCSS